MSISNASMTVIKFAISALARAIAARVSRGAAGAVAGPVAGFVVAGRVAGEAGCATAEGASAHTVIDPLASIAVIPARTQLERIADLPIFWAECAGDAGHAHRNAAISASPSP